MNLRTAFLLLSLALISTRALGQSNPYDDEVRTRAAEVARDRGPEGMLSLFKLWEYSDLASPAVVLSSVEGLWNNRRLPQDRRAYVGALLARLYRRNASAAQTQEVISELGYVRQWFLTGGFDNEGKHGFERDFGPEGTFDPAARFQGKDREVGWRQVSGETPLGFVDVANAIRPSTHVCAYATTWIDIDRSQNGLVWFGSGGTSELRVDGEVLHSDPAYRQSSDPDRLVFARRFAAGRHRIQVKECVSDSEDLGFYLRVTDDRGVALGRVGSDGSGAQATSEALASRVRTTFQILEASPATNEAAQMQRARFLVATGADDVSVRQAKQIATTLHRPGSSKELLLFLADQQTSGHERLALLNAARVQWPNDQEVARAFARATHAGLFAHESLRVLDAVRGQGSRLDQLESSWLRAELLHRLEMTEAAYQELRRAAGAFNAPLWQLRIAALADAAGHHDEAVGLRSAALPYKADDRTLIRQLLSDAMRRNDTASVRTLNAALLAVAPTDVGGLLIYARHAEGIGDIDDAMAALEAAELASPDEPAVDIERGRFLLRRGQREAALTSLEEAGRLRPQDAETRALIERLSSRRREDESRAVEADVLRARVAGSSNYHYEVLQDLTVTTVFENGLGSSFHQLAWQVNDEQGARELRTYGIQWDPGSEAVDVRLARVYRGGEQLDATQIFEQTLGEPWYRMYYDTRAKVVVLPSLQPGDIVELRWRIDDTAHRNAFADYFGEQLYLEGYVPIRSKEWVISYPTSRTMHFSEVPSNSGVTRTESVEGTRKTVRIVRENIAALRDETGMPPFTETGTHVLASTYRGWPEVGRWYWGLIRDQLRLDETMRATVAELIRGKTTTREKTEAIHRWVLAHTRYVALEFGIHGYKPYRVSEIVSRGFGDCKDKASLLYSMLREAGVETHFVLARTRRNGRGTTSPASLAIFDHAIAFVPELNLYIDGTAEQSGIDELPEMDQGIDVLHVWPEGAELRTTPLLQAARSLHSRRIEIRVNTDGSGEIRGNDRFPGNRAAYFRSHYEAVGTRETRLQDYLQNYVPGVEVSSATFSDLSNLNAPVDITWSATARRMGEGSGNGLDIHASFVRDELRTPATQSERRRQALDLGPPSAYEETRLIEIPEGAQFVRLPDGLARLDSPFGVAEMTVTRRGDRMLEIVTRLEWKVDRVSASQYSAYRDFVERIEVQSRAPVSVALRGGAR